MTLDIVAILRGLVLKPKLVAFARGLLETAGFAALLVIGEGLASADVPDELQPFLPLVVLGLRFAEGVWDSVDPAKQRRRAELAEAAEIAANDDTVTKINDGDVVA
jgi:hypothetical protein